MTATSFIELKAQREELDRRTEEARLAEYPAVCVNIRSLIKEYGIRPEDLFPGLSRAPVKTTTAQKVASVKYKGPDGQTWGGGPGRKPNWVNEAIKAGKDIEQFRVD